MTKMLTNLQMNAPPPKAAVTVDVDTTVAKDWTWWIFNTAWGLIPLIFGLLFSAGAAYLSYQRNQSGALAVLAFFFATIYYPYYAFTTGGSTSPTVTPASTLMTAGKRLAKALRKH